MIVTLTAAVNEKCVSVMQKAYYLSAVEAQPLFLRNLSRDYLSFMELSSLCSAAEPAIAS